MGTLTVNEAPHENPKTTTDLQSEFVKGLSSDTELTAMMTEIVEWTAEKLNAEACTVFIIDEGGRRAKQIAGSGYQKQFNGKQDIKVLHANDVPEKPKEGDKLGLTGWILSTGMPFLARTPEELTGHPHHSGKRDVLQLPGEELRLQSFLGVPLLGLHGEVIGVIKAERRQPDIKRSSLEKVEPFSVQDQLALETIARIAGRCRTYFDMVRGGKESEAITAWARDVIAEAVATEGELDSFLDIVVKVTAAAMKADSCGIFLMDERKDTLTQRAGSGSQALRKVIRAYLLPKPELLRKCKEVPFCRPKTCASRPRKKDSAKCVGLTAWIAATGKSFSSRNKSELAAHCHHKGGFDPVNFPEENKTECGAFLGVPLRVGGTIIGVVKVENIAVIGECDSREFTREAQQRFEILALDIALAIMRLQTHLPARYRVIRDAQETILHILGGGLEIPDLAQKVVTGTKELFNAGACALFLKEGNKLRQIAASGYAAAGPPREYELVEREAIKENPTPDEKVGLTVWMAVMPEKFTAKSNLELKMHPHHRGAFDQYNFAEGDRCESLMGFPLLIKEDDEEKLVGVLKVESKMKNVGGEREYTYFNELDEIVFELIANSAAIAIQNARLLEAHRDAEAAQAERKAWKEFGALAAHRIGSETLNIRGALRWLEEDLSRTPQLHGAVAEYITRIKETLKRTDTYVREFSEFAKPPKLDPERVDVNGMVIELKSITETSEGIGGISVDLRLADDLPYIWADGNRLFYVLMEMFQNAIRAMPDGGSLMVSTSVTGLPECVRIEFSDTGGGIAPENKEKIFEATFRLRKGGTGLGLAIVKQAVEEHLGKVREIGVFGEGAHFVIELPVSREQSRDEIQSMIESTGHGDRQDWVEHILIVEDTEDLRFDLVKRVGYGAPHRNIICATNEMEAMEVLGSKYVDLVITDIDMQESGGTNMGGLRVIEAARKKDDTIPVIVVTTYGKIEVPEDDGPDAPLITMEEKARRMGALVVPRPHPARDYLDVVEERVTEALERRREKARVLVAP